MNLLGGMDVSKTLGEFRAVLTEMRDLLRETRDTLAQIRDYQRGADNG